MQRRTANAKAGVIEFAVYGGEGGRWGSGGALIKTGIRGV